MQDDLIMNSSICKLCKSAIADQTGSHIIPAFLISSGLNYKGKRDRDNELFFAVSSRGFNRTYFGRKILPDTIKEIKGRDLTDEEIENNRNRLIVDFIFCCDCEKKLSVLEGFFSREIYDSLVRGVMNFDLSDKGYGLSTVYEPIDLLIRLFVISIVWRASVSGVMASKFKGTEENKLRKILYNCLDLDINVILRRSIENEASLRDFPIIMCYSDKEAVESTRQFVYGHMSKIPYFLVANQFMICFYAKGKQLKAPQDDDIFGLMDMIDRSEVINYRMNLFKITKLTREQTNLIKGNYVLFNRDHTVKMIKNTISRVFEHFFKDRPSDAIKNQILYNIVNNDASKADRFSEDNILKHISAFLGNNQLAIMSGLKRRRE